MLDCFRIQFIRDQPEQLANACFFGRKQPLSNSQGQCRIGLQATRWLDTVES